MEKAEIITKIEKYIQYKRYKKQTADELKNTLKIFFTVDSTSMIKYIEMLFESDFEKSEYAKVFIDFICTISSDDIITLIEKLFYTLKNSDLKKRLIKNCPNTDNYKIRFFLYKITDDILYSTEAKLALLKMNDVTFENDLLKDFRRKLEIGVLMPDYLESLSKSGSRRVWKLIRKYVSNKSINEKDRYRILNIILKLKDKNSATTLIDLYEYYEKHPEIEYEDVKDFNFNLTSIIDKNNKPSFYIDTLSKIYTKLKKYNFINEVNKFLKELNQKE